jgi:hypothetical protein
VTAGLRISLENFGKKGGFRERILNFDPYDLWYRESRFKIIFALPSLSFRRGGRRVRLNSDSFKI